MQTSTISVIVALNGSTHTRPTAARSAKWKTDKEGCSDGCPTAGTSGHPNAPSQTDSRLDFKCIAEVLGNPSIVQARWTAPISPAAKTTTHPSTAVRGSADLCMISEL